MLSPCEWRDMSFEVIFSLRTYFIRSYFACLPLTGPNVHRSVLCFHWLINYTDIKVKCCHLEILTCKWTWRQVFIRPYRLEIQSVMLVQLLLPCQNTVYTVYTIQTVCGWGGGGCRVLLETIFFRSWTLCIRPDSEPTKLPDHPQTKTEQGGGLGQINNCCKVPLQVIFFRWRIFALVSLLLISPWIFRCSLGNSTVLRGQHMIT